MLYTWITEIVLIIVSLFLIVTQILMPAIKGSQLFPLFRKQIHLEDNLAEEIQKAKERALEKEIASVRDSDKN